MKVFYNTYRIALLILIGVCLLPTDIYASVYGTLKGKVVDEDGKPAIGASVKVVGTTRGAKVKVDGEFTIVNILAGNYDILVTYTGKSDYKTNVNISADKTTEITVKMKPSSVMTQEVIVSGKKDLVSKTDNGRITTMDTKELTATARFGINQTVSLAAGVAQNGSGFSIRGARDTETQVRVDGIDVSNQFTGGFGASGAAYFPMISQFATEEVQVLTGGFGAEYGEAMGGVVNSVAKTGRLDKYEGFLVFRTDLPSLNGSQAQGISLKKDNNLNRFVPVDGGDGLKLLGENSTRVEMGFGGPLPFLDRSSFYMSASSLNDQFRDNGYDLKDPLGNNWGQLDNNNSQVLNLVGRAKFGLTDDIQLIVGGSFGRTSLLASSPAWLYSTNTGVGVNTDVQERVAKQNATNVLTSNFMVRLNHTLSENSFYEFTVSQQTNSDESARRKTYGDPDIINGYDLYKPEDNYVNDNNKREGGIKPKDDPDGFGDKLIDIYQQINGVRKSTDGQFTDQFPVINPLTGFYEGLANRRATNNAWGLPFFFNSSGNTSGFAYRYGGYLQVDGHYTIDLKDDDFGHQIKAGFEARIFNQDLHSNPNPWDGAQNTDVYSNQNGGNLYAENQETFDITSQPKSPKKISLYVTDQISFKGLIITPGLRLEYFDPNSPVRTKYAEWIKISELGTEGLFADASAKMYLAPRINVNYPLTERSKISINYGIYYKMPELQRMYDGTNLDELYGGSVVGNPDMKPQRSNDYQVTYDNQLTDEFMVNVAAYYKDIYNQLGYAYVQAVPVPYNLAQVSEYGSNKGLEFEIRKLPTDNFGFRFNYTIAQILGTSTGATSNVNIVNDPITQKPAFPLNEFPLDRDIRHRANLIFDLVWGNDEGPEIFGFKPLANARINISGTYRTGFPYTFTQPNGTPLGERNALRGPDLISTDMKILKAFKMSDFFGDDFNNSRIEFYLDVTNFINRTVAVGLYSATNDPNDNGFDLYRELGTFNNITYYKEANLGNSETVAIDQYDFYGNRMYNAQADHDNNGRVTIEEVYQSYIDYTEFRIQQRPNFQAPRQIFFGVNFTF
jgi:hypothetical protein